MSRKISIIGAGNVGGTLALRILEEGLGDVVLIDVIKNLALGKAYDLQDAIAILGLEANVKGTDDYKELAGSDMVVLTAGKPRRPGMSREDLLRENAQIVKAVAEQIKKYAKDSIVIVVTNPLDVMSYLVYKITGFSGNKIMGMAGILDAGRLSFILSEHFKTQPKNIQSLILGSHGDSMVTIFGQTFLNNKPVTEMSSGETLAQLEEKARKRGGDIVSLLGNGSAYYGPSAATLLMMKAIIKDERKIFAASALLNGEYGLKDVFIGVPVRLGREGIEKIIEIKLDVRQKEAFLNSANVVKQSINQLKI